MKRTFEDSITEDQQQLQSNLFDHQILQNRLQLDMSNHQDLQNRQLSQVAKKMRYQPLTHKDLPMHLISYIMKFFTEKWATTPKHMYSIKCPENKHFARKESRDVYMFQLFDNIRLLSGTLIQKGFGCAKQVKVEDRVSNSWIGQIIDKYWKYPMHVACQVSGKHFKEGPVIVSQHQHARLKFNVTVIFDNFEDSMHTSWHSVVEHQRNFIQSPMLESITFVICNDFEDWLLHFPLNLDKQLSWLIKDDNGRALLSKIHVKFACSGLEFTDSEHRDDIVKSIRTGIVAQEFLKRTIVAEFIDLDHLTTYFILPYIQENLRDLRLVTEMFEEYILVDSEKQELEKYSAQMTALEFPKLQSLDFGNEQIWGRQYLKQILQVVLEKSNHLKELSCREVDVLNDVIQKRGRLPKSLRFLTVSPNAKQSDFEEFMNHCLDKQNSETLYSDLKKFKVNLEWSVCIDEPNLETLNKLSALLPKLELLFINSKFDTHRFSLTVFLNPDDDFVDMYDQNEMDCLEEILDFFHHTNTRWALRCNENNKFDAMLLGYIHQRKESDDMFYAQMEDDEDDFEEFDDNSSDESDFDDHLFDSTAGSLDPTADDVTELVEDADQDQS